MYTCLHYTEQRCVVALIYIHQEHSKQLLLNDYNTPTGQKNMCEDASGSIWKKINMLNKITTGPSQQAVCAKFDNSLVGSNICNTYVTMVILLAICKSYSTRPHRDCTFIHEVFNQCIKKNANS